MWIMTNFGILMPASIPDNHPQGEFNLQVRARDRAALQKFRTRYMAKDTVSEIEHTLALDYEYRFYCHQSDFANAMFEAVMDIDYVKFKPTTLRRGGGGESLHNLYNALWFHIAKFYHSAAA